MASHSSPSLAGWASSPSSSSPLPNSRAASSQLLLSSSSDSQPIQAINPSDASVTAPMVNHPFSGSPIRLSPPRSPFLPPRDALRALLHMLLNVTLNDGRILTGHLLAVDAKASLLLSSVRETRVLPPTEAGAKVAQYYPFSRNEGGAAEGPSDGGYVRERELASVLVPMRHVVAVELSNEDAESWGRFAGVRFERGTAVPPARTVTGAA